MNTPSHSTAHWGSAQQLAPMAPPWGHPTLNTVPSGGPRCRRPELGSCPPHLVHTPCQLHTPAGLSAGVPRRGTALPLRPCGRRRVGLRTSLTIALVMAALQSTGSPVCALHTNAC